MAFFYQLVTFFLANLWGLEHRSGGWSSTIDLDTQIKTKIWFTRAVIKIKNVSSKRPMTLQILVYATQLLFSWEMKHHWNACSFVANNLATSSIITDLFSKVENSLKMISITNSWSICTMNTPAICTRVKKITISSIFQ